MEYNHHNDYVAGLNYGDKLISKYSNSVVYSFRNGPVPKYSWIFHSLGSQHDTNPKKAYGSYRRPKTFRTHRLYEAEAEDGVKFRTKACSRRYLPSAWDDKPSHNEKCWKRHRHTQYK
jgi:hypothetical protein